MILRNVVTMVKTLSPQEAQATDLKAFGTHCRSNLQTQSCQASVKKKKGFTEHRRYFKMSTLYFSVLPATLFVPIS